MNVGGRSERVSLFCAGCSLSLAAFFQPGHEHPGFQTWHDDEWNSLRRDCYRVFRPLLSDIYFHATSLRTEFNGPHANEFPKPSAGLSRLGLKAKK